MCVDVAAWLTRLRFIVQDPPVSWPKPEFVLILAFFHVFELLEEVQLWRIRRVRRFIVREGHLMRFPWY